ncbi:MAG: hypothetical protein ACKVXR_12785 [Planctomycetota bacterium]
MKPIIRRNSFVVLLCVLALLVYSYATHQAAGPAVAFGVVFPIAATSGCAVYRIIAMGWKAAFDLLFSCFWYVTSLAGCAIFEHIARKGSLDRFEHWSFAIVSFLAEISCAAIMLILAPRDHHDADLLAFIPRDEQRRHAS